MRDVSCSAVQFGKVLEITCVGLNQIDSRRCGNFSNNFNTNVKPNNIKHDTKPLKKVQIYLYFCFVFLNSCTATMFITKGINTLVDQAKCKINQMIVFGPGYSCILDAAVLFSQTNCRVGMFGSQLVWVQLLANSSQLWAHSENLRFVKNIWRGKKFRQDEKNWEDLTNRSKGRSVFEWLRKRERKN